MYTLVTLTGLIDGVERGSVRLQVEPCLVVGGGASYHTYRTRYDSTVIFTVYLWFFLFTPWSVIRLARHSLSGSSLSTEEVNNL